MDLSEHARMDLEIKARAREHKNVNTTELNFNFETLKESDQLFLSVSENGIYLLRDKWIKDLYKLYYKSITFYDFDLDEFGEIKSTVQIFESLNIHSINWKPLHQGNVKTFKRLIGFEFIGEKGLNYIISKKGNLYINPFLIIDFTLQYDVGPNWKVYDQVIDPLYYYRVYRISINAKLTGSDFKSIGGEFNYPILTMDFTADQIAKFEKTWQGISECYFLIDVFKWAIQ